MHFFFNDPSTTEIYTLSLHDALPILRYNSLTAAGAVSVGRPKSPAGARMKWSKVDGPPLPADRKSTRLNSSHLGISYAVFCLKKKKKKKESNATNNENAHRDLDSTHG